MRSIAVLLTASVVFAAPLAAQHSHSAAASADTARPKPARSPAAQAFATLKALAGTWEGATKVSPPQADWTGDTLQVTMRVTSSGHALMHEMVGKGGASSAGGGDNADPISMMYVEAGRVLLTHYCDAGNRPRMVASVSPDGKTIDFQFLDIAGVSKYGYMNHVVFTILDADHHTEDWTLMHGDSSLVYSHIDLHRVPAGNISAR